MVLGCYSPGLYSRGRLHPQSQPLHLIHVLDPLVRHHSHHLRFLSRFKFGQIAAGTCAVSSNRLHVCMLQHTGFASDRKPQSAVWISVGRSWTCASGEKHIRLIPTVSCFRLEFFLFFLVSSLEGMMERNPVHSESFPTTEAPVQLEFWKIKLKPSRID